MRWNFTGLAGVLRGALTAVAVLSLPAQAALEISDPALPHNFATQPVGSTHATQYFSLFNRGTTAVTVASVRLTPEATATCMAIGCPPSVPAPFIAETGGDGCSGRTLQPGAGCSMLVMFSPYQGGVFSGEIIFSGSDGQQVRGGLLGTGRNDPADCLFDWAERSFPGVLTSPGPSQVVVPYYGRCYAGNTLCVATDIHAGGPTLAAGSTSLAAPSVYLYQSGQIARLGWLHELSASAGCSQ